ncbi:MAG: hypothetical protein WD426_08075 [Anditalea sp.]
MSDKVLSGLIKFGKRKYMDRLLKDGELHLKNLQYYKKIEDDGIRGDNYEGVLTIRQIPKNYILKYGGKKVGTITSGQFKEEAQFMVSIYCMFGIDNETVENNQLYIDRRNFEFGDTCVFIHNVREFAKRCKRVLGERYVKYEFDKVRYYNQHIFEGEINPAPFRKRDIYKYQNEYRIAIATGHLNDVTEYIGCIEDIAKMIPIAKLGNFKEFFNEPH